MLAVTTNTYQDQPDICQFRATERGWHLICSKYKVLAKAIRAKCGVVSICRMKFPEYQVHRIV